jgi:uncharacterized protein YukE
MKLNQDFLGAVNQLRARLSEFDIQVADLMSHWRDTTSSAYQDQHLAPVPEVMRRLILSLQEAAEKAAACSKELDEEELY